MTAKRILVAIAATLVVIATLTAQPLLAQTESAASEMHYDLVIYGGTSAGVIAAVEAKRHGMRVVLVGPDRHLGGLTAGGLGWTDTGNKAVIGGLAREFYHRIWKHYAEDEAWTHQLREDYGNRGQGTPAIDGSQRTMWIFEPHVAENIFDALVAEHEIPIHREKWLDRGAGVQKDKGRIRSIRMLDGTTYHGKYFIDASYEGDLLAAAGVAYHVGREASSVYDEKWNGIQVGVLHHSHWFRAKISPYKTPGDPSSGLLPRISPDPPGKKGDGDHRVQAYCYRMCLTDHAPNRIPFAKPTGYDANQYELMLRVLESGWRELYNKFDPIPNHKTDTNNHGPFSTDNIGMNYDYPDGTYARRQEILEEHKQYQQGLLYFLANDPRVPSDVRSKYAQWGLAKDEFVDNQGWPHQIYVRESRRMIGDYVMTEHDVLDQRPTPKSIGMGSYTLDSHNVQRYVTPDGYVQNEGDLGVKVPRPYEISYGSIVPKKDECQNLLVPVCVSSSHIAFGSIRMEPVFMILGHSAATAVALALEQDSAVQDVPYEKLKQHLLDEGQVLGLEQVHEQLTKGLKGIVVDDQNAELHGAWKHSTANSPFIGLGYQHDNNESKGVASAVFRTELKPGKYQVRMTFPPNSNRATNTHVEIRHQAGVSIVQVNQRAPKLMEERWVDLGSYQFAADSQVKISNSDSDGYVIIDAIQWIPVN